MTSGDFQSILMFRQMARLLRAQIQERGVELAEGAAEALLAHEIRDIAPRLGLTEHQMASSLTPDMITALADDVRRRTERYLDAVTGTEPITLSVANAGRVVGGIGMVIKLAFRNAEAARTESMDVIGSAADTLSVIGGEIRTAADSGSGSFSFGGLPLTQARQVLSGAIDLIRTGRWECPSGPHADVDVSCPLTEMLSLELGFLGGWPGPSADR